MAVSRSPEVAPDQAKRDRSGISAYREGARRAQPRPPDVPITVNVAASNLLDSVFPATVDGLLRDAGIAADRLCIEVTENAVMADTERMDEDDRDAAIVEAAVTLAQRLNLAVVAKGSSAAGGPVTVLGSAYSSHATFT
jgi:EAL domain-containing protein (putative c-di-GMP-specific phosphodiesterase class I)